MKTKFNFLARYKVDCVPPQSPAEVTEKVFGDDLDQVINEEELALHRIDAHDGVHFAKSEVVGVEDIDVRTRVFTVRHVIKLWRTGARVDVVSSPLERVHDRLIEELHLESRQTEGPYNIVEMELSLEQ